MNIHELARDQMPKCVIWCIIWKTVHWRILGNHILSCGKQRKICKQIADLLQDIFWFNLFHIVLFQGALEISSVWMITAEICWDHRALLDKAAQACSPHHRKNTFHHSPSRLKLHLFHNTPTYLLNSNRIYHLLQDTLATAVSFLFFKWNKITSSLCSNCILNSILSTSLHLFPLFRIKSTFSERMSWESSIN